MEFKWVEFPFSYNAWSEEKSVHKSIKIICFVEVLYWCSVEYKLAFLLCDVVTKEKVSVIVLISGWFPPTQESISVSCKLHHLMIFFLTLTFPKIKHMFADLPQQESESFLIFSWMHPPPLFFSKTNHPHHTHMQLIIRSGTNHLFRDCLLPCAVLTSMGLATQLPHLLLKYNLGL